MLVLFRHAKAERPVGVGDFERPLTDRGQRDSRAAGTWLAANGYRPDLVLCSSARRARQTWKYAATVIDPKPAVDYRRELYDAGHADELLAVIREAPPSAEVVAVVGHNPTMEWLSSALDPGAAELRTAGIAVHAVDGEWASLGPGAAPVTASTTARG
jgi:phosphohistidine phosphatase